MARSRPASNGPTSKSAPTTQKNGIKKSSKPAKQQLYVVSRETNDPEGVHDNHEIVGTYKTLAAANAAARDDLIKGWGREYFDTYEASEVDVGSEEGDPTPKAVEEQSYVVLRRSNTDEVKNILGPSEIVGTYKTLADANAAARGYFEKGPGLKYFQICDVKKLHGKVEVFAKSHNGYQDVGVLVHKNMASPSKVAAPLNPDAQYIYTLIRETLDLYKSHGKIEILSSYDTLAAANEAARNNMIEEWGRDYFEEYEVREYGGMVRVNANCPDGKGMYVRVDKAEVKKDGVIEEAEAENLTVDAPGEITVYHVSAVRIDYQNDPDGVLEGAVIKGTYLSPAKANKAAREYLAKESETNDFGRVTETVIYGMVTIKARCPKEKEVMVYVDKGKLFTDGEGLEEMEESEGSLSSSSPMKTFQRQKSRPFLLQGAGEPVILKLPSETFVLKTINTKKSIADVSSMAKNASSRSHSEAEDKRTLCSRDLQLTLTIRRQIRPGCGRNCA
ncbi:hypothetical protein VE01_01196 [Pseudogymnoascus verrucosus]|uniref:Uncharacterized protein n=1 Tax=Pseudogymnoascus verrucosus TaxID=342668 RepID=A0A1B8GY68_9PEZI|nr:uncharacterized protein VE01_01196 [Pseudogymnoascus verrucosus]OBU00751.1 hypothetical protein VE01_01196 [Pseudogymnoascus verrucosus]